MDRAEYGDRMILALKTKCGEKQTECLPVEEELGVGTRKLPLHREILFDGLCSMMLPDTMTDMDEGIRTAVYRSANRPQIIKTDEKAGVTITFSLLPVEDVTDSVPMRMDKLRSDMKKLWKQNVFYDRGEIRADGFPAAWMDCKAFCLDGSLYCLLFMFQAEGQMILGNFHCSFPQYDTWKPAILKLLATLQGAELD